MAVERETRDFCTQQGPQLIVHGLDPGRLLRERSRGDLAGRTQPDDGSHILGAGPQAALVAGAAQHRLQGNTGADVQGPDALGRVERVASGCAPMSPATWAQAFSTASRARRP
jgi:hypothetical protein